MTGLATEAKAERNPEQDTRGLAHYIYIRCLRGARPGSHGYGHAITVTCRSEQRHACEALQLRGVVEEWSQLEGPWLQCNNPDRDPWRQLDAFQRCPSQWPMKCRAESGNLRDVKPDGWREPTSFGHDRHGRAQGCTYRAKCKYLAMATSHRLRRQCAGIRGEPRKTS
jgi:hypothetical protein